MEDAFLMFDPLVLVGGPPSATKSLLDTAGTKVLEAGLASVPKYWNHTQNLQQSDIKVVTEM